MEKGAFDQEQGQMRCWPSEMREKGIPGGNRVKSIVVFGKDEESSLI